MKEAFSVKLSMFSIGAVLLLGFLFGCVNAAKLDSSNQEKGSSDIIEPVGNILRFQMGKAPENIIISDFDNDGVMDIASCSHGASLIKIFKGLGQRRFRLVKTYDDKVVGHHPRVIKAVDWDEDGRKDIICSAEGVSSVIWLKNEGDLDFQKVSELPLAVNPRAMDIRDLDDDGKLDIVLGPYDNGPLTILWGKSSGKFEFDVSTVKARRIILHLEVSDWNLDGKPDIFWSETHSYKIKVALNQGKRKFQIRAIFERPEQRLELPRSVAVSDINGDQCKDVVAPLEIGEAAVVIYGDCKGGILTTDRIRAPSYGFRGVGAVSAGKGHPAMIALGETDRFFIGIKSEEGRWILHEFKSKGIPEEFEFLDIDKDGVIDLFYLNRIGESGEILYGPLIP